MHKIVYLDAYTTNHGDISWNKLEALGEVVIYDHSTPEEILERAKDAQILLVNKARLDAKNIPQLSNLQLIVVSATGYNNVDIQAAQEAGVTVCNVKDYSTTSVAQHVFSMIFALYNRTEYYNYKVRKGTWSTNRDFCFYDHSIEEIAGKTLGIIGYGNIGKKVAQIATAFGMKVLASNSTEEQKVISDDIQLTDQNSVIAAADILSLHAPLTNQTKYLINKRSLQMMKPDGILINTSRGGLINEFDLSAHLARNPTFFALIDVLSVEPPTDFNALIEHSNCLVTPHIAWASKQARIKLIDGCVDNILAFQNGEPINVVS
ncbi:MAG: D-2-hydroxyacid dehydrogenase [Saprospiraceae bacterium]|nr:D-2-hydroxyacid dehydrogenase [Saprospiraceae bacterium]